MKHFLLSCLSAATMLGIPSTSQAQQRGLPFLSLSPDARSVALGGNTGGESRSNWIYTNPSSFLQQSHSSSVGLSSTLFTQEEGTQGRYMLHTLSAAHRWGKKQALFLGFRYAGGLSFSGYDWNGQATKDYRPFDWAADLGYAHALSPHWALSARASFVYSHLSHNARTAAAGLGVHYRQTLNLTHHPTQLVASLQADNFGPKADYGNRHYAALPAQISLGGSLTTSLAPQHQVALNASIRHLWAQGESSAHTGYGVGAEYNYRQRYSARIGWEQLAPQVARVALGVGAHYGHLHWQATYLLPTRNSGNAICLLGLGFDF